METKTAPLPSFAKGKGNPLTTETADFACKVAIVHGKDSEGNDAHASYLVFMVDGAPRSVLHSGTVKSETRGNTAAIQAVYPTAKKKKTTASDLHELRHRYTILKQYGADTEKLLVEAASKGYVLSDLEG